jgi:hypothetical protein
MTSTCCRSAKKKGGGQHPVGGYLTVGHCSLSRPWYHHGRYCVRFVDRHRFDADADRRSILMPTQIWILTKVLHMFENLKFFTFIHSMFFLSRPWKWCRSDPIRTHNTEFRTCANLLFVVVPDVCVLYCCPIFAETLLFYTFILEPEFFVLLLVYCLGTGYFVFVLCTQ